MQTVIVTNGSVSALTDLSIGTISYGGGAFGGLGAVLSTASAPDTLTLAVVPGTIFAGTYTATVPVISAFASNSPLSVTVTLTVLASAAHQLVVVTQPAGRNGVMFDTQPAVEIRDAAGVKVAGATNAVTVSISSGIGTLTGTTTVSAVAGVAKFTDVKITGTGSGFYILGFESGSLAPASSASFFLMSGVPTAIVIQSGNNQTASVSTALAQPLTVRVADIDGFGVPGVTVTWLVPAAAGSLSSATSTTDSAGMASNRWTLGPDAGLQSVSASVVGTIPATFVATATALFQFLQSLSLR